MERSGQRERKEANSDEKNAHLGSRARRERKRRHIQESIGIDVDADGSDEEAVLGELGDATGEAGTASSSLQRSQLQRLDHGFKLEPFNVKRELHDKVFEGLTTTGRTQQQRKRKRAQDDSDDDDDENEENEPSQDSADEEDAWFQSVREQGERAYALRDTQNQADRDASASQTAWNRVAALEQLAALLEDEEETPLQAIKRLQQDAKPSLHSRSHPRPEGGPSPSLFDSVIELADALVSSGTDVDVYSETKQQLQARAHKLKDATSEWEYTWDASDSTGMVYGPFSTRQMHQWRAAGHFSAHAAAAFRRVGSLQWIHFHDDTSAFSVPLPRSASK